MSARFIDTHRDRWPVAVMCRVIGVPERTYYAAKARPPPARDRSDEVAKVEIRRVFDDNYQCYGARRIYKQLRREGHQIARCTVERLMPCLGIRGVQRGKQGSAPGPVDSVCVRIRSSLEGCLCAQAFP